MIRRLAPNELDEQTALASGCNWREPKGWTQAEGVRAIAGILKQRYPPGTLRLPTTRYERAWARV